MAELQDIFYECKKESMEKISDDELVDLMKQHFDGECEGSLDYLRGTILSELCRMVRDKNGLSGEAMHKNERE